MGHGLNSAPGFIIIKRRDSSVDWVNYHSALGVDKYVQLSLTDAATTSSGYWGTVNSNTFGLPSFSTPNASGGTFVALCFAPVAGFSAFGRFYGNSSTDGVFQHCGFTPRWIIMKRDDGSVAAEWRIIDTARSPFNVADKELNANLADAESTVTIADILSNGFKMRTNTNGINGANYIIWAAFAEHPFKTARAK